MRRHRFFLAEENWSAGQGAILTLPTLHHQVFAVLRLRVGEEIILFNNRGQEVVAQLVQVDKTVLRAKVIHLTQPIFSTRPQHKLYCSILKKNNFELLTQKVVELGLDCLVPLICERTVKTGLDRKRLEKIIIEATEQCGRNTPLWLADSISLTECLAEIVPEKTFLADSSGQAPEELPLAETGTAIIVGPEGGFSPKEKSLANDRGVKFVALGQTTLRAETAAIISAYCLTK